MINVNDFKNMFSTKETRSRVLSLLNPKETTLFKAFVKSVESKK